METVQGNLDSLGAKGQYSAPQPEEPVLRIDLRKCQSIEEMGHLLNTLGMGMTRTYAKENKLEHLFWTDGE